MYAIVQDLHRSCCSCHLVLGKGGGSDFSFTRNICFSLELPGGLAFMPFCTVLIIIEMYTYGCFEQVFSFCVPTHSLPLFIKGCDAFSSPVCNVRSSLPSFYSGKSSSKCYPSIISCCSPLFVHHGPPCLFEKKIMPLLCCWM